jgi:[acyl-carrier-protein] S-malonyltransferase
MRWTVLLEDFEQDTTMSIGLLFSGQGAQTVGMGKSLYDSFETAKNLYDEADAILGWELTKASFEGPDSLLTETRVCQPALYVHGYAVFSILREQGKLQNIRAAAGLSLGELTALASAGVFDFATGLKLVAKRGELMQMACDATKGSMASLIGGTRDQAQSVCDQCGVEMANLNCPGQIVISGEAEGIKKAVEIAKGMGFKMVKELNVAGAYHSRLMKPASEAYAEFLKDFTFSQPAFPVYTNTTGLSVSEPEAIKQALVKQVVSSVLFEDCMRSAQSEQAITTFVECGVAKVIGGLVKRTDRDWKCVSVAEANDIPESI